MSKKPLTSSESHLPPWQQTFRGLRWSDMPPQKAAHLQKLNFALYRRGLYDPELDVVEPEVADLERDDEADSKLVKTEDGRLLKKQPRKKSWTTKVFRRRGPRPMTEEGKDRVAQTKGRTEDGRPVGLEIKAWLALGGGREVWRLAAIVDQGMTRTLKKLVAGGKSWLKVGTSDRIRAAMVQVDQHLLEMAEGEKQTAALHLRVTEMIQRVRAQGVTENYMCRLAGIHNNTIYRFKTGVKLKLETLQMVLDGLIKAEASLMKNRKAAAAKAIQHAA